jgi:hypothetical protein
MNREEPVAENPPTGDMDEVSEEELALSGVFLRWGAAGMLLGWIGSIAAYGTAAVGIGGFLGSTLAILAALTAVKVWDAMEDRARRGGSHRIHRRWHPRELT